MASTATFAVNLPIELADPTIRLMGYLDSRLVSMSIDLRVGISQFNTNSSAFKQSIDTYSHSYVVRIPGLEHNYYPRSVEFINADLSTDSAVVLGHNWIRLTSKRQDLWGYILNVMHTNPYIDRLFCIDQTPYCIMGDNADAVSTEISRHFMSDEEDCELRRTSLILHILSGQCVNVPLAAGCQDIVSCVPNKTPWAIVSHVVTNLLSLNHLQLPVDQFLRICSILPGHNHTISTRAECRTALIGYANIFEESRRSRGTDFCAVESMNFRQMKTVLFAHGLHTYVDQVDYMKDTIYTHLTSGSCASNVTEPAVSARKLPHPGCRSTFLLFNDGIENESNTIIYNSNLGRFKMQETVLKSCLQRFDERQLRRLFRILRIPLGEDATLPIGAMRSRLRDYIKDFVSAYPPNWPATVTKEFKDRLIDDFRRATGKHALQRFVCASCGELRMVSDGLTVTPLTEIDLVLLIKTGAALSEMNDISLSNAHTKLMIDAQGVVEQDEKLSLKLCNECHRFIVVKKSLPALSFANGLFLGDVPPELADLTPVEESLISMCRARCWIVQLTETGWSLPNSQRALRGHVLIFPQNPEALSTIFPPTVEEITQYICIVFVGSSCPSDQWIRERAKPLLVRRDKVRRALTWLREHNELYKEADIDESRIQELPENGVLPFHIHCQNGTAFDGPVTGSYDPMSLNHAPTALDTDTSSHIVFDSAIIVDVENDASSNQLRTAALRHMKTTGKGFVEVRHGPDLVNQFWNPSLFPAMYPTLFPYGIGGFEDDSRVTPLSMERHARHLLSLADRRFQLHHSFIFSVFNLLQRRQALRHTKFKVDAPRFRSVAKDFSEISVEAVHRLTERVTNGDGMMAHDPDEASVLRLMREVKMITSNVWGSSQSRRRMRDELRALMITSGMPSYFVTINPADVYNPVLKFLSGESIDVDRLLPEQVPTYWEQSILVAENPIVSAQFFNVYMKAFLKYLIGSTEDEISQKGGILGKVKAHYGCVEAQGRGTLHCHLLIWVDGALNPNEIRDRIVQSPKGDFVTNLIHMLDDTIHNEVPEPADNSCKVENRTHHPCSVRGVQLDQADALRRRRNDMYYLVRDCQTHAHSHTCFKYWKGPPEPKECRFDLDEANARPLTVVNPETGELTLRCLNGLVNNYNSTIIEAVRCNMDIKFIGSGQSAKAVIHYVTDYISKTQLKAHVAFAALEIAVRKLGNHFELDDQIVRAKRLLQKCVYAIISHQELSAQQVASYLMTYEDHFTSHKFRAFWWGGFEIAATRMEADTGTVNDGNLSEDWFSVLMDTEPIVPYPDEVLLESNNGELSPRVGVVADYLLRPTDFEAVTVWDFISRTKKEKIRRQKGKGRADDMPIDLTEPDRPTGLNAKHFHAMHLEKDTHRLVWLRPSSYLVPVPQGGGLPRRDKPESYDQYCKVMLTLFKPWRHITNLRGPHSTWGAAFEAYKETCPARFLKAMDNMQLLHECRDSKDDHFAERRARRRVVGSAVSSSWVGDATGDDDDLAGGNTENEILDHLQSIDDARSLKKQFLSKKALACANAAEEAGLFNWKNQPTDMIGVVNSAGPAKSDVELSPGDRSLETEWRQTYEKQREDNRKHLLEGVIDRGSSGGASIETAQVRLVTLSSSDTTEETTSLSGATVRAVHSDLGSSGESVGPSSIATTVSQEFTLNTEQLRSFDMIVLAADKKLKEPLRLYIGGPGGSGKSRVIDAICDFFTRRNERRRLRLTSFTGVAAHNISGMTLHAALSLNPKSSKTGKGKTRQDLIAMWEGVDFLFIDEVSMIGCHFLLSIHQALTEAKSDSSPFGGVNIIFAGDFAQLPPVGQTKLFTKLNTKLTARSGTMAGQRNILGKLLWLQIKNVVLLHRPMRQIGPHNTEFVSLLERLRLGQKAHQTTGIPWNGVPIIVGDNASKDILNKKAAVAFALTTGSPLFWYQAADYHRGKLVQDPRLLSELGTYHSGQTGYRLGRLPLCAGMPVILSQNYDVENGIVNGSFGTVQYVRYCLSDSGQRLAASCVIRSTTYKGKPLPSLEDHEIAVIEDSVDLMFTHPHSGKKCKLQRRQLPLFPAFAITVYKAQGLTFPRAVVDLESCLGIESAPFGRNKITARQSEDSRYEFKRLEILHLDTLSRHSTDPLERTKALKELRSIALPEIPNAQDITNPSDTLRIYQELVANISTLTLKEAVTVNEGSTGGWL